MRTGRPALRTIITWLMVATAPGVDLGAQPADAPSRCKPAQVIPLTGTEPTPRLFVEGPLPEPLASRGVAVLPYCAEHMRIAPIFGPGALSVSPRVGHVHVTVDAAPWHWADASGTPVILQGLPSGPHEVWIELVDANHRVLERVTVRFDVPGGIRPPQ